MAAESSLTMTGTTPQGLGMRATRNSFWDSPWPWLIYLTFYPIPWLWVRPTTADLFAAVVAITLFLPVYVIGHRSERWRPWATTAILAIGVGVAIGGFKGSWTVFAIYAGAMIGSLRPAHHALIGVGAVMLTTLATGLLLGQPVLWWLPGAMLVVMTGAGTISREAFWDRTVALSETQGEVRRLAGTAERERITRDLHDVVGRTLTLVALKADLAARLIDRDPTAAEAEMRAVAHVAREGLGEVRLTLAGQAGGSLAHEIDASTAALNAAGIMHRLEGELSANAGDAGAVLAMTLREAITNVIRHAGARQCAITVSQHGTTASLTVADDGRGGVFREGNGIRGMRQRVVAAGGRLDLVAGPTGTRLVAEVPA
ncbi:two-component system, NarL family, sensor histidine kinase DesK [Sphingomonas rubra]|uniref:Two-component system, NarL family, sensor histidine kinase DesK n=2 Tax=Sphingomonas rubra TaxID=634430 RepID=A0A1I5TBL8_9SPHN|nr:two-component system, NarL family, sensor histidine kinase DesK [Sphingomonas rubra]